MLYGLADEGNAPSFLLKLSSRGVPVRGILISSGITLIVAVANFFFPGKVFMYFMSIATAAAIIDWVMIDITHLKFREYCRKNDRETSFVTSHEIIILPIHRKARNATFTAVNIRK